VLMALCAHTHGGQVHVPFYGPPVTHTRVAAKVRLRLIQDGRDANVHLPRLGQPLLTLRRDRSPD
jgi:hypothetical protein